MRWALIQYDWCPYKKEKFGSRDRHTQRMPHGDCSYSRHKVRGLEQTEPFLASPRKAGPCQHLDLEPMASRAVRQCISVVQAPQFAALLCQPQETNTLPHWDPSQTKARSEGDHANSQLCRKCVVQMEILTTGIYWKALSRLVLGLLSANELVTHVKPLSFKQGLKVPLSQNSCFLLQ